MSQLFLFQDLPVKMLDTPELKNIESVSVLEVIKEMNIFNAKLNKKQFLLPTHDNFVLYKTGGKHFWHEQDKKLFSGDDYPFVFNNESKKIMGLTFNNYYPAVPIQLHYGLPNNIIILFHRLICTAFVKNPNNNPLVDHIDGNPVNYRHTNLRWVTRKENRNTDAAKVNRSNFVTIENKYYLMIDKIKSKMNETQS